MSKLILNAAGAKRPRVRQPRLVSEGRGHPGGREALGKATSEPEKGIGLLVGLRKGIIALVIGVGVSQRRGPGS